MDAATKIAKLQLGVSAPMDDENAVLRVQKIPAIP